MSWGLSCPTNMSLSTCAPGTNPATAQADPDDVIRLMAPELEKARAAGVDRAGRLQPGRGGPPGRYPQGRVGGHRLSPSSCPPASTASRGSRPGCTKPARTSCASGCRASWKVRSKGSGVQAGFIKLSAGDDGITATEAKVLRAAARAAEGHRRGHRQPHHPRAGGARPARHHRGGRLYARALHLDPHPGRAGFRPAPGDGPARRLDRVRLHRRPARGPDSLSTASCTCWTPALASQLLLSHDRGWYDPAQPGGGTPQPFTYLTETFLPKLRAAGVAEETARTVDCR